MTDWGAGPDIDVVEGAVGQDAGEDRGDEGEDAGEDDEDVGEDGRDVFRDVRDGQRDAREDVVGVDMGDVLESS